MATGSAISSQKKATLADPLGQEPRDGQLEQRGDGEEEPLHLLPLGAAGPAEPDDDGRDRGHDADDEAAR